jgi:hypothetical protein
MPADEPAPDRTAITLQAGAAGIRKTGFAVEEVLRMSGPVSSAGMIQAKRSLNNPTARSTAASHLRFDYVSG